MRGWIAGGAFVVAAIVIGCGGGGGGTPPVDPPDPPGSTAGISGMVVDQGTTAGLQGVVVKFYTSSGAVSGSATTDATGAYKVKIDPASTLLQLAVASIPLGYHRTYAYANKLYAPALDNCKAPLPPLDPSRTTTIPTISLPSNYTPPPPPPTGCQ